MNLTTLNPVALGTTTVLVTTEPVLAFVKERAPKHWALEAVLDGAGFGIGATTLAATVSMSIPMFPAVGIGAAAGAIIFTAYQALKRVAIKAHEALKKRSSWYASIVAKIAAFKDRILGNSLGERIKGAVSFVARNLGRAAGFVARLLPFRAVFLAWTPVGMAWTAVATTGAVLAAALPTILSMRPVLNPIAGPAYLGTTATADYLVRTGYAYTLPTWSDWVFRGLWASSALMILITGAAVAYTLNQMRRERAGKTTVAQLVHEAVAPKDSFDELMAKMESHYPEVKTAAAKIDAAAAARVNAQSAAMTSTKVVESTPDKQPAKVVPVNMSVDAYSAKLVEHGLEGMLSEPPTVIDDIRATVASKPLPRTTRTKGGGRKVRPPEPHIGKNESVLVASSMSEPK